MSEKTLPERVASLEQAFISMSEKMSGACSSIDKIDANVNKLAIDLIKFRETLNKEVAKRPSWLVCITISFLCTTCGTLVAFILSNLHKF